MYFIFTEPWTIVLWCIRYKFKLIFQWTEPEQKVWKLVLNGLFIWFEDSFFGVTNNSLKFGYCLQFSFNIQSPNFTWNLYQKFWRIKFFMCDFSCRSCHEWDTMFWLLITEVLSFCIAFIDVYWYGRHHCWFYCGNLWLAISNSWWSANYWIVCGESWKKVFSEFNFIWQIFSLLLFFLSTKGFGDSKGTPTEFGK